MKLYKYLIVWFAFCAFMLNCSSDDGGNNIPPAATFAMTAEINGEFYGMMSPFLNNEATSPAFYVYYPDEEYIHLQGRVFIEASLSGILEINMWINRNDLVVGETHTITPEDFSNDTFIEFINTSNYDEEGEAIYEDTLSGSITITQHDPIAKTVQGTFEFDCAEDTFDPNAPVNFEIRNGTFNYIYDVED